MKRKKKSGKFQLRRSGVVLKSKKMEKVDVEKPIVPKIKEVIKLKDRIPESGKAIIPIVEDVIEEENEVKNCGLSEEEVVLLEDVGKLVDKTEYLKEKDIVEEEVDDNKEGLIFGNDIEDAKLEKINGDIFLEFEKNEIIELNSDSEFGIYDQIVSRIRAFKEDRFIRISNGSTQKELFSKAIESVYLKEDKYKLKTVPYLHVVRGKKVSEINLCSEIMNVNGYAYFVIIERSKKNKNMEIQKVILLDTNFILN